MRNRIASYGIAMSVALVLTGCGGGSPAGTDSTDGQTAAAESPAPSPSKTPTPTPTSTPKAYTNEELAALVTGLKDAGGRPFSVIPAAQLDEGILAARELLKTAVIEPKICNVLAENQYRIPEGSTYAGGTSLSTADKTAVVITVFATEDPTDMETLLAKSQDALAQCSTFTIEAGGKKITSHIEPIEVRTDGDESLGALSTQTAPTGEKVSTVTVTAVKDGLAATAVKTGAGLKPESATGLTQLVNDVLGEGAGV